MSAADIESSAASTRARQRSRQLLRKAGPGRCSASQKRKRRLVSSTSSTAPSAVASGSASSVHPYVVDERARALPKSSRLRNHVKRRCNVDRKAHVVREPAGWSSYCGKIDSAVAASKRTKRIACVLQFTPQLIHCTRLPRYLGGYLVCCCNRILFHGSASLPYGHCFISEESACAVRSRHGYRQ